jgi:steroid 5-alpha reductase family enzyme
MKLIFLHNLTEAIAGANGQLQNMATTWIIFMVAVSLFCFLISEVTFNYSQVDKLWSLLPLVYSLITLSEFPSARLAMMSIMVAIWGFRLSYNFYRKGGYNIIPWKGEEDYRWKILRENPALKGRLRFGLFNFFFISFYQNFLILLFSSPLLLAAKYSDVSPNTVDFLAGILMFLFITLEAISDNQLFGFHELKRKNDAAGKYSISFRQGFLSEGLWRFVRHPNFASEQAIWISFYLFGVAASGKWLNWTLTGAVLLVLLFQGSSEFTEKISRGKYPGYSEYRKKVPRFLPRPW